MQIRGPIWAFQDIRYLGQKLMDSRYIGGGGGINDIWDIKIIWEKQ